MVGPTSTTRTRLFQGAQDTRIFTLLRDPWRPTHTHTHTCVPSEESEHMRAAGRAHAPHALGGGTPHVRCVPSRSLQLGGGRVGGGRRGCSARPLPTRHAARRTHTHIPSHTTLAKGRFGCSDSTAICRQVPAVVSGTIGGGVVAHKCVLQAKPSKLAPFATKTGCTDAHIMMHMR